MESNGNRKIYKLQGNGKHSWRVVTKDDNDVIIKEEMVYSDNINFDPTYQTEKPVKLTPLQYHKLLELFK